MVYTYKIRNISEMVYKCGYISLLGILCQNPVHKAKPHNATITRQGFDLIIRQIPGMVAYRKNAGVAYNSWFGGTFNYIKKSPVVNMGKIRDNTQFVTNL